MFNKWKQQRARIKAVDDRLKQTGILWGSNLKTELSFLTDCLFDNEIIYYGLIGSIQNFKNQSKGLTVLTNYRILALKSKGLNCEQLSIPLGKITNVQIKRSFSSELYISNANADLVITRCNYAAVEAMNQKMQKLLINN